MAKGYNSRADVLTRTVDNVDFNDLWDQFSELLGQFNSTRQTMIDLLSTTADTVITEVQMPGTERFEEATEFGIPVGIRPGVTYVQRALPFKFYDLRSAFTFQYLLKATSQQLNAITNMALEADNALQFELVMKALFNNANRTATIDGTPYTVAALYNGDGSVPPTYKNQTFAGTHTHYVTSGAAALDPQDILDLGKTIEHHGYTQSAGYDIVVFVNPDAADTVRSWRRGVVAANTVESLYDFIPPAGQGFFLPVGWDLASGSQPAAQFGGMDVVGKYGPYLVVQDYQIPSGYILAAASQGRGSALNLIGLREHENPAARGLILKPGNNANYPLIDSYYIRGLGAGVLQRGAAAIMQVTASGSYTVPAQYA
jgi:hypothetical protein